MGSSPKVLLSDNWHFHRRNFRALLQALDDAGAQWRRETRRRKWLRRHGDYHGLARELAPARRHFDGMGPEEVQAARHKGLALFEMCRAELFCLLVTRPHWKEYEGPYDNETLFRRAWEMDREDLLLNLAAARHWIDFWEGTLARGAFTHAITFSGSYIYSRTLLALCEAHAIPAFVAEHFFTGNEFYLEPRFTPLPNNSRVGRALAQSQPCLPDEPQTRERLLAEMHRRLSAMRNKNVRAAQRPVPPPFPGEGRTMLVIGQVLNDFSLLETRPEMVFSIPTYKKLLNHALSQTDMRVVFKAHPWERRRYNLDAPATREALSEFLETLPEDQKARLRIVEDVPLKSLFPYADLVLTLCSQGALEACQAGFKPVQLGNAFYGGQGFTHDFENIEQFSTALNDGALEGTLNLGEYRAFEAYMTRALLLDLYRNDSLGRKRLTGLFSGEPPRLAWEEWLSPLPSGPAWPTLSDILSSPCPWLRDGGRWLARKLRSFLRP